MQYNGDISVFAKNRNIFMKSFEDTSYKNALFTGDGFVGDFIWLALVLIVLLFFVSVFCNRPKWFRLGLCYLVCESLNIIFDFGFSYLPLFFFIFWMDFKHQIKSEGFKAGIDIGCVALLFYLSYSFAAVAFKELVIYLVPDISPIGTLAGILFIFGSLFVFWRQSESKSFKTGFKACLIFLCLGGFWGLYLSGMHHISRDFHLPLGEFAQKACYMLATIGGICFLFWYRGITTGCIKETRFYNNKRTFVWVRYDKSSEIFDVRDHTGCKQLDTANLGAKISDDWRRI